MTQLTGWALVLRAALPWSVAATLLVTIICWVRGRISWRGTLFIAAVFALGPGLIVNAGFKTFGGRPRPIQTELLGGPHPFQPWWRLSGPCARNCSFPSGDVAGAAALAAPALILTRRRRRGLAMAAVGGVTVAVAAGRMALGAHHLSDGVAAALIVWGLTYILYICLKKAERHG